MKIYIACCDAGEYAPLISPTALYYLPSPIFACSDSWDGIMELIAANNDNQNTWTQFSYIYEFEIGQYNYTNRWCYQYDHPRAEDGTRLPATNPRWEEWTEE